MAVTIEQLIEIIPGPDFPTGGQVCGRGGIYDGYRTGRGKVTLRARASINEEGTRTQIIIHEVPYQQTRKRLGEGIGELVKGRRVAGSANYCCSHYCSLRWMIVLPFATAAGRRATASIAARQVRRHHRITVIRAGEPSAVVTSSRQVAGGRAARPRWYLPTPPR